ncbi:hypothetical protein, partial [Mesorhizobium sp. M7A.F.Ca.US.003.02.1.1]|uniref:hypothetical protein n=1 Tax=Mesorhizobium sp. M7A.F.Ca.US.003.02.1.1 TaxID=2496710 RepID=UPI0019CF9C60
SYPNCMAKRRRSGVPKLKGSLTLATSISGPTFFRSVPEVRRLIRIGPKNNAGRPATIPEQSPRTGSFRLRLWHQYANIEDSAPLREIAQCVARQQMLQQILQYYIRPAG